MKKLIAILLSCVFALSLISCTNVDDPKKPDKDSYIGNDVPKNEDGGIELPIVDVPLG